MPARPSESSTSSDGVLDTAKSADGADGCGPYDGGVLRRLRIDNLVLIREAELELDGGLNAITGETGAGKTILSNAIGLLLGARGEAAMIGVASDEAYVEAELDLPDDEIRAIASLAVASGLAGLIATNTTVSRDGLSTQPSVIAAAGERGSHWMRMADRPCRVSCCVCRTIRPTVASSRRAASKDRPPRARSRCALPSCRSVSPTVRSCGCAGRS